MTFPLTASDLLTGLHLAVWRVPRFHLVTGGKVLIVVVSAQAADRTGAWVELTPHHLTAVLTDC
jgi:hypothetical protein